MYKVLLFLKNCFVTNYKYAKSLAKPNIKERSH